jgi:dTDP-4-dehydrorhamnose reductase
MKIVIFGRDGQLGHALCRAPAVTDIERIAFNHQDADITDQTRIAALIRRERPDVVVNAAAYTDVDGAETTRDVAFAVNAAAPGAIARACADIGAALVHVSTDFVFDGAKSEPYDESDAVNPINVYGESKAAGEDAVRSGLDRHVILRTSWVFGAHGRNFVKTMLRLGGEQECLSVVDDRKGCPTPVNDLAGAIDAIVALISTEPRWGTYHFTCPDPTTWYGFAREIFRLAAPILPRTPRLLPIPTEDYPLPARRPRNVVLDCRRIVAAFGVTPVSWKVGLSSVIEELAANER